MDIVEHLETLHAQRLRLMWSDLLGLARGKYVPKSQLDHTAHFCIGGFVVGLDREIVPVEGYAGDIGFPDMVAPVDVDSIRPGWEPGTAVAFADLEYEDGSEVALDPRGALKHAIAAWRERGLEPQLGFEMEFYLMAPDGDGWKPVAAPGARVYGVGRDFGRLDVVDDIFDTCIAAGLPVEALTGEFDAAQAEVVLGYTDALRAADDAFLFQTIAREVAERHGLGLTFLGRPFDDRGGNGLHVNFSVQTEDGRNAFDDPDDEQGLSSLARSSIAGMLAHHRGLSAICAPTVNAYKRLLPGMLNGYFATWGWDNRTVAVRVPSGRGKATRLEARMPDGAASPYLVAAGYLHAALMGVESDADPGEATLGNGYETAATDVAVPADLSAALDALEEDGELVKRLGDDLVRCFVALKRAEWERFKQAVTDWELREYLPYY
jgi:glutamine synthetase